MHQYHYQYIFILVRRSSWKVSWQKQWSHDNYNPLIFATGKWCRKHPVCNSFALNIPNCLQQNEIFKILQRKHSGFWITCLHSAMNRALGYMALIAPSTSHLREDSCTSHPMRPCQHPPPSNSLVGSLHTWQHFQQHIGSCLTTFRIKILLAQHARKTEKLPKRAASPEQNHLHNVEEAERGRNIFGFCTSCKILNTLIASHIRDNNKGSELTLCGNTALIWNEHSGWKE